MHREHRRLIRREGVLTAVGRDVVAGVGVDGRTVQGDLGTPAGVVSRAHSNADLVGDRVPGRVLDEHHHVHLAFVGAVASGCPRFDVPD